MIHLVEYDRSTATLATLQEFSPTERHVAEEMRLCIELELLASDTSDEVVLLEARNEEGSHKTHRRYLEGLEQLLGDDSATTD